MCLYAIVRAAPDIMALNSKSTVQYLLNSEDVPVGKLSCDYCEKSFDQRSNLNKHINVVHFKLRPWKCPDVQCGKDFAQRCVMQNHIRTVHKKEKPYRCDVCRKAFADPSNKKKHVRLVHQKLKKYACNICKKRFGENRSLTNHVREKHMQRDRDVWHAWRSTGVSQNERRKRGA